MGMGCADEVDRFCNFQWETLNPLNHAILCLHSQKRGTCYRMHDGTQSYHHEGLFHQLGFIYGKLFGEIGYPLSVPASEGLSFGAFVEKIRALTEMSLGLTEREAKRLLPQIEIYAEQGFNAAAPAAKGAINGSSPATSRRGAWLKASEPLLIRMKNTLKELERIEDIRTALPQVFGDTPEARLYLGLEMGGKRVVYEDEPLYGKRLRTDKDGGPRAGKDTKRGQQLTRAEAMMQDDKLVFHFADGYFSMKTRNVDWQGICQRLKWDANKLCGPVTVTCAGPQTREFCCLNSNHRRPPPRKFTRPH